MLKCASSQSELLKKWIKTAKDLVTDGKVVFCNACSKKVSCNQKYQIDQHLATNLHKEAVKRSAGKPKQPLISGENFGMRNASVDNQSSEFHLELCRMMVRSNIPWHKLEVPAFRDFLEKYCNRHIPNESTLGKNYLNKCYEEHLANIREKIGNKNIYFVVDETTDVCGRYVANLLVGVLDENIPPTSYLIQTKVLEKTNHATIARFVNDSLVLLYSPDPIKSENVKLMLSDAAAYMIKAGQSLQIFFPNLIHLTCMAHGLNRLAELVRTEYPLVNTLVNNGKKVFLKAPLRVQRYRDMAPELALPPEPIITRWGTWLNAVEFYADNFKKLKELFLEFEDESAALQKCKQCFNNKSLAQELAFLKTHLCFLSKSISDLEKSQMPLVESLQILKTVKEKLNSIPGKIGILLKSKLSNVLLRNPGYEFVNKICQVLKGNVVQDLADVAPTDIAGMKYAPITSCDVERSFSMYKNLLASNRQSLTPENIEKLLIVYCNAQDVV